MSFYIDGDYLIFTEGKIPEATCQDAIHIARMYSYPNGSFENEPEAPADVEMKSEPEQPSESEQDRIWRITQEIAQG